MGATLAMFLEAEHNIVKQRGFRKLQGPHWPSRHGKCLTVRFAFWLCFTVITRCNAMRFHTTQPVLVIYCRSVWLAVCSLHWKHVAPFKGTSLDCHCQTCSMYPNCDSACDAQPDYVRNACAFFADGWAKAARLTVWLEGHCYENRTRAQCLFSFTITNLGLDMSIVQLS